MQRVVIEGRCARCGKLLFERSVEDQGTTPDLQATCLRCVSAGLAPYVQRIRIRPIIQAPVED